MGHILFYLIVLSISAYRGTCVPLSWHTGNLELLERYERDVDVDSGGHPCNDDEDSPCEGKPSTNTFHLAPYIRSLHVETTITTRYASTTVIIEIQNDAAESQDSDFGFRLSEGAFISDFFMIIKGVTYQAVVRKKEEAQKVYNEARRKGLSAGHIKQSGNDLSKFETNVNLSPNTTATFYLSFQEHLRRKNGVFQHMINIYPKEVVRKLRADVYIREPQGISFVNISWVQDDSLSTDFLYDALTVKRQSDTRVHAIFNPSYEDQEGLAETGLQGDLVITYDVVHDSGAGHIEIVNGYFVHHISPEGLPITPKTVIFVIDVSGSMGSLEGIYGSKLDQTKQAMATIIDEIREFDYFNIISFSDHITVWQDAVVEATSENKMNAKTFVDSFNFDGGTDIHGGLMDAISRLKGLNERDSSNGFLMIILLTDGEPTSGITDTSDIIKRVTTAADHKIALFSLAFGASADYDLLQLLSGHNHGLARKIYPDSSPSVQLSGFYKEVATPLLHNIAVVYSDDAVDLDSLTKSNFISYFEGTELVIAGKIKEDYESNELSVRVSGHSFDVQLEWELTKTIEVHNDEEDPVLKPHQVNDFVQRLWAYVTIKELLSQLDIALTSDEKDSLRDKVTYIALQYRFVTPLTSLIVIKPEDEENYGDIVGLDDEDTYVHESHERSQMSASVGLDYYSASVMHYASFDYYSAPAMQHAFLRDFSSDYQPSAYFRLAAADADSYSFTDLPDAQPASIAPSSPLPGHTLPMTSDAQNTSTSSTSPLTGHTLPMTSDEQTTSIAPTSPLTGHTLLMTSDAQTTSIVPTSPLPGYKLPMTSVDGDPRVFVTLPGQNTSICFEITGENGMIMNLLSDKKLGIDINAVIHAFSGVSGNKPKSFFTTFGVTLGNRAIIITPRNIETEEGLTLDWKAKSRMVFDDFILRVEPAERILHIYNMKGVSMYIRRHSDLRTKKKGSRRQTTHVEHLGLYFQESTGFTETLSGILGQFYSSTHEFRIEPIVGQENIPDQEFTKVASLVADGTKIPVVWHEQSHRNCWHAGSNAGGNLNSTLFKMDRLF